MMTDLHDRESERDALFTDHLVLNGCFMLNGCFVLNGCVCVCCLYLIEGGVCV